MKTSRMRYSVLGILVLAAAVGLAIAWRVSHILFGIALGFIALCVTVLVVARDGWRQTSPQNLTSRGFRPDSVRGVSMTDPGLRREIVPLVPGTVSRRISGDRIGRLADAPVAVKPSGVQQSARRSRSRRKNEALQAYDTVSLAEERSAAGIDDLFTALDIELVGLLPV